MNNFKSLTKKTLSRAESVRNELKCEKDLRLSNLLYEIRTKSKVSQAELADFLGVSQSVISSYELGRTKPDQETVEKICSFLNIDTLAFYATILSQSKYYNYENNLSIDFFEKLTSKVWAKAEDFLEV